MGTLVYDFGGTAIKLGLFEGKQLKLHTQFPTPSTFEECQALLMKSITKYEQEYGIEGIALSMPGAVDTKTGIIGGASAIPYIHNFEWYQFFQEILPVPVSMNNDANCSALGEVYYGSAAGSEDVLFIVIGTGIGGAIVKAGQIHSGVHLHGGEFGYMIHNRETMQIWSEQASTHALIKKIQRLNPTIQTGEQVFELAKVNQEISAEVAAWYQDLALGIYNLQYSFDPECIVIAGGVSEQAEFQTQLEQAIQQILDRVGIATVVPTIKVAANGNRSNLYGAYAYHQQVHHLM
ncbi:MAG: ROK family protein [Culicoidibacterales bacterium]